MGFAYGQWRLARYGSGYANSKKSRAYVFFVSRILALDGLSSAGLFVDM